MGGTDNSQNKLKDCPKEVQSTNVFTIFHVNPAFSEEIYIDEMAADTENEARKLVEHCFTGHTILIIRKQVSEKKADYYPNARFINGKFRASLVAESTFSKGLAD